MVEQKSYASIYGKMMKRDKNFNEIYDLYAIRVLVNKLKTAIWHWELYTAYIILFKIDLRILLQLQSLMAISLFIPPSLDQMGKKLKSK